MTAYREASQFVEAKAAALARDRRVESWVPTLIEPLYGRRLGRIAFGMVGSVGAGVGFATSMLARSLDWRLPAIVFFSTWIASIVAYFVVKSIARSYLRTKLNTLTERTGDPYIDVAKLTRADPAAMVDTFVRRHDHKSFAWPLVAFTLLGPITLHLIVGLFLDVRARDFAQWVQWATIITGLSHVVAAYFAWQYPRERRFWTGLWLAAGIPIIALLALSPFAALLTGAVIFLTGAVVGLLSWAPLDVCMKRERQLLEVQ